jgi:hypothetical protein
MIVRNTGSAPFYLNWPVAVALLDPQNRKAGVVGAAGRDRRSPMAPRRGLGQRCLCLPHSGQAVRRVRERHASGGTVRREYILAIGILDREGGMVPSVRFAIQNYFTGGWHPFGFIGVGVAPRETALKDVAFDSPAFDRTLSYQVPEELLAVQSPPAPMVTPMPRWAPDPKVELINPWRYWTLIRRSDTIEKRVSEDGPVEGPAGRRVISVVGDFGRGSNLSYTFFNHGKIDPGHYRFSFRVKGTKA